MNFKTVPICGAILLFGVAAWAQEFPKTEIGFDYSYARYGPSTPYSKGHSLNGGGGSATVNLNSYLGIKLDLQGYGSNLTGFNISPNPNFPLGALGNVQGNLFTYMLGPQIKVRTPKFDPFAHLLFGGAHTNVYGHAFNTICQSIVGGCGFSKTPAADAFAMAFGGGVDIPLHRNVSIRPAEIDYLLTRFVNPFTGTNNQNNFRYSAGIVFTLNHNR
jgi:hypothetical protein